MSEHTDERATDHDVPRQTLPQGWNSSHQDVARDDSESTAKIAANIKRSSVCQMISLAKSSTAHNTPLLQKGFPLSTLRLLKGTFEGSMHVLTFKTANPQEARFE